MGTWGTAVFSDDLAADVRADWRGSIADGLSPQDATDRMIAGSSELLADSDDASVFWIALAVAQWKTGRLLPEVRDRAIGIIDSGEDLARWDTPKLRTARQRVLVQARAMLLSPQPDPKRIRRPWIRTTSFERGDIVQVDLSSGHTVLLVVVYHMTGTNGDRCPIFATLNWMAAKGTPLPDDLAGLWTVDPLPRERPAMWSRKQGGWPQRSYFAVGQLDRHDNPDPERVRLVGQVHQGPIAMLSDHVWWRDLDVYLITRFCFDLDEIDPADEPE